jgi:ABC-2 type transport system permease protein
MSFIHDTLVVFRRELRLSLRNPAWVVIALAQPVLYLALFGPLLTKLPADTFSGSADSASAGSAEAYRFFVPGLLIQLGLFGSTFVGFAIISDWRGGVIERFRVTPVSRLAVMSGRVLRDTMVLVVQAVILVLVGVGFGLRASVSAVFISLGFIVLVAVGLASVSYATALTVKSEDAFAPMLNSVIVPLVLLSGIMLPLTLAPGWLQGVARISPFRYIIDAMREAFAGHYANTIMLEGVLVAAGLAVVCLVLAGVAFGLRAPVTAVLISLGFIVFVAVGLASVSYATALTVKSEDAFAPLLNSVILPLVLLSGIMLPLTLAPGWLQGVARISPFRYIIDAMREAFAGHYANTIMLEGVLVAAGLAVVCLWLGSRVFVRENA